MGEETDGGEPMTAEGAQAPAEARTRASRRQQASPPTPTTVAVLAVAVCVLAVLVSAIVVFLQVRKGPAPSSGPAVTGAGPGLQWGVGGLPSPLPPPPPAPEPPLGPDWAALDRQFVDSMLGQGWEIVDPVSFASKAHLACEMFVTGVPVEDVHEQFVSETGLSWTEAEQFTSTARSTYPDCP